MNLPLLNIWATSSVNYEFYAQLSNLLEKENDLCGVDCYW